MLPQLIANFTDFQLNNNGLMRQNRDLKTEKKIYVSKEVVKNSEFC